MGVDRNKDFDRDLPSPAFEEVETFNIEGQNHLPFGRQPKQTAQEGFSLQSSQYESVEEGDSEQVSLNYLASQSKGQDTQEGSPRKEEKLMTNSEPQMMETVPEETSQILDQSVVDLSMLSSVDENSRVCDHSKVFENICSV